MVFAWYSKVIPDIRFLAPLVPLVIAVAARELWKGLRGRLSNSGAWRAALVLSLFLVGAGVLSTVWEGMLTRPQPLVAMSPAYQRLLTWIDAHLGEGDTILHAPTDEFHGLLWTVRAPLNVIVIPNARTREEFLTYLAARHVTHLVVHRENVGGLKGQLKEALAPYWAVASDGSIEERTALPGWTLVARDPVTPPSFLIYSPRNDVNQEATR